VSTLRSASPAPADPLLAATRRRLAVTTMAVVGTLVLVLGVASVVFGLRALDSAVDQALDQATTAEAHRLEGEVPAAGGDEGNERAPQSSDTFFLVLDPQGKLLSNPSKIPLGGLPDEAAVQAARASGSDVRSAVVQAGPVRLETVPIGPASAPQGWVQAGHVLTLHEAQSGELVAAIVIVGLLGLAGAALVTVWITGRALVPIRRAFATERRFVADASHEIRTPTAIIRASAEVLQREDLVRPGGRELAEDIVAEADRLGQLVEELLALAASERGALAADRRPIDLAEVALATVRRAGPLAAEQGLVLEGPPGVVPALPVLGDPDRLVQLLLVLLDNAFRVSPPGGHVAVSVGEVGRRGQVVVDDQGPGVPAEQRERIFEPFARLPDRRRESRGSGLGLAIARRIAELHGGTLGVGEAPGGGARFVLEVPLR
jgi:two-component system sensor histidine kinase CiaH